MFLIARLRALDLRAEMERRESLYAAHLTGPERLSWQLAQFNRVWKDVRQHVPFYRRLADRYSLPREFASWQQFSDSFPPIDKNAVREQGSALYSGVQRPDFYRMTGGSTAIPVQLPSWNTEWRFTSPDRWIPRRRYGIRVEDKQFAVWGHSHTLGTGITGFVNKRKRQLKDYLLGYYRVSAYDMSDTAMRRAGDRLLRFRPAYIYGYSVALDRFASVNRDRTARFRNLGLSAVIGAAEAFPSSRSMSHIEEIFGARVALEYGSVETELVAHTRPGGGYDTFWQTYFLEAIPTGQQTGAERVCKLLITSLYRRCFPLIRYDLGDEVCLSPDSSLIGLTRFERVRGRCNDYLIVEDGTRIHSELITHCVRSEADIEGYQAVQDESGIRLEVVTAAPLASKTISNIQYSLGSVHKGLSNTPVKRVPVLRRTMAGKSLAVVRTVPEIATSCTTAV